MSRDFNPEIPSEYSAKNHIEQRLGLSATAQFEQRLLGGSGILHRIDAANTRAELKVLASDITRLIYDAEGLILLGHADATSGLIAYTSAAARYSQKWAALPATLPKEADGLTPTKKQAFILETVVRIASVHPEAEAKLLQSVVPTPIPVEALSELTNEKIPNQTVALNNSLPHRVLKARLLVFLAEKKLLPQINSTHPDELKIDIELNDIGDILMNSDWDLTYQALPNCDEASFSKLKEDYVPLVSLAKRLNQQNRQLTKDVADRQSPEWVTWYKEFSAFEDAWMQFQLRMIGKVELIPL